MASTEKQAQDEAEFASQFDAAEPAKTERSDDEEFGLSQPAAAAGTDATEAAAPAADAPAADAPAVAAPAAATPDPQGRRRRGP